MATPREARGPVKLESNEADMRKGKWTIEEENYANKIITLFNQGMLPVVVGTTLRTYLSDKLRCDPMRITKKYAGASCIGKQVFQLADNYYEAFQENERELQRLETLFLARINGKGSGLSGKRSGSSEALSSHPSIYETTNPDRAALLQSSPPLYRRTPKGTRKGSPKESGGKASLLLRLDGSPGKQQRHHAHGDDYALGDDYEYAYDPDCDDGHPGSSAVDGHFQDQVSHGGFGSSVYSSFGRRVLSAPNLTELSLSNWKQTDYRPLPADSLKELFSLPITGGGEAYIEKKEFYGDGAQGGASLLPEHVYSALGNESGRYARHDKAHSSAATVAAAMRGRGWDPSQDLRAHARTTDDAAVLAPGGAYNSLQAKKRCFSAMALVDFEKLAVDDAAAGDLFLEFLSKVGGGGNATKPNSGDDIAATVIADTAHTQEDINHSNSTVFPTQNFEPGVDASVLGAEPEEPVVDAQAAAVEQAIQESVPMEVG